MDIINELKKDKALLEKRLGAIDVLLEYYSATTAKDTFRASPKTVYNEKRDDDKASGYNRNWTLVRKFVFLLKENGRFLHFREAAEMIAHKEDANIDVKKLASKLSSATAPIKRSKEIVKVQADTQNQNTFWGRSDWLNDDGSIKKGHKYNEEYLSHPSRQTESLFDDF